MTDGTFARSNMSAMVWFGSDAPGHKDVESIVPRSNEDDCLLARGDVTLFLRNRKSCCLQRKQRLN